MPELVRLEQTEQLKQLANYKNLYKCYKKVLKNKTANRDTLNFIFNFEFYLKELEKELLAKTYQPDLPHTFTIHDPKKREITSYKMQDMIVHRAILESTANFFSKAFIHDSYGGLPNKGPRKAIKKAQSLTRKFSYYLKCDVANFYATLNHNILKKQLNKIIKNKDINELIARFIDQQELGVAIGSLLSQYFGNLYLAPMDHYIKCYLGTKGYVRYMDDFILFSNNRIELEVWSEKIKEFLKQKLVLEINLKIQRIDSTDNGVDFLGFKIFKKLIRVLRKNMVRIRSKIKYIQSEFNQGNINEQTYCAKMNSYINHLKTANTFRHNKKFFYNELNFGKV